MTKERNFNKISKYQYLLIVLVFILNSLQLNAKTTLHLQTGYAYIEHLSTGLGITIGEKHNISALYGSDFFVEPQNFSAYLLQYDYTIKKDAISPFSVKIGIKGGYSIYTNTYYKWELLGLVPYIGLSYPITSKIDITATSGIAFSREISMERISMGEIGRYKNTLPEFKISFSYEIF